MTIIYHTYNNDYKIILRRKNG